MRRSRMIEWIASGTSTAMLVMLVYLLWSGQIVPRERLEEEERRRRERHYWIADRFYASELTERPSLRETPSMREYPVLSLDEDEPIR
jgi:hypothetical protein